MKNGYSGLFVPGPTNIPESVRRAMDVRMEDHRAPDLPDFILPLLNDVATVFKTTSAQAFIFPGSGTAGWEAGLTNTLNAGDKVLISRFGQFSHLWTDMCERMGFEVVCIEAEWGEGIPVERYAQVLADDKSHEIKAVLATHNETATGVSSDIEQVRQAMDACSHPALLMVDGVSSIGSIDFRMDDWGVDIAVSGSQKGFMLPAGLAILCVSQKALEASRHSTMHRCYLDFADMSTMNAQGYFPYTPAMQLLRGLRVSVDRLMEEGLDNVFARHHRLAEGTRRAVAAWGLSLCAKKPQWYSDTVTAIVVPEQIDSAKLIRHAYDRYQLSLGAGLGAVAGKVFRIGHLGDLNELMLMSALGGVEMAMLDSGISIEPGSGVGAAVDYYRQHDATDAQQKGVCEKRRERRLAVA